MVDIAYTKVSLLCKKHEIYTLKLGRYYRRRWWGGFGANLPPTLTDKKL